MTFALAPAAEHDRYIFHIWADDPEAAARELDRLAHEIERFAALSLDDPAVFIKGWPRPVRTHYIHPFRVYYERQDGLLYIVRRFHHARRPIVR